MRILVAPDKFKGSLTAAEVCHAIHDAIHAILPDALIESIPMADGGEGTCLLLTEHFKGKQVYTEVHDPLFRKIKSSYGISNDGTTAWIEMASASGLSLLDLHKRDPLYTSSFGTGEMILHALNSGVKNIVLGIGGSATTDGGIGMAAALGYRFFDEAEKILHPIGKNLIHLKSIEYSHVHPRLGDVTFIALADVQNPLVGTYGAAAVFGPQKGANEFGVKWLERGLTQLASVIQQQYQVELNFEGAGAGGGMGGGACFFLHARLVSGITFLMQVFNLEEKIKQCDAVITGEGKMDTQTLSGKVIQGICHLAKRNAKRVFAVVGKNELSADQLASLSLKKVVTLQQEGTSSAEAHKNAFLLVKERVHEEIIPLLLSAPAD